MSDPVRDPNDTVPVAIEAVVSRLNELEVVVGPRAAPVIRTVRDALLGAMAARDRGDRAMVTQRIAAAMERLADLAHELDPAEAQLMRVLTDGFRAALLRGNTGEARQHAEVMFERSGATEIRKR